MAIKNRDCSIIAHIDIEDYNVFIMCRSVQFLEFFWVINWLDYSLSHYNLVPKISSTIQQKSSHFNEYFLLYTCVCVYVWNLYVCYTHESSEWKFYGQLHSLATCLFYSQVLINLHPRCFDDEFNESLNFDDDFFLDEIRADFSCYKSSHVCILAKPWRSTTMFGL